MSFRTARLLHRSASVVVAALGAVHAVLTFVIFDSWSPDAVWFFGTGLSLVALAVMNWAHVGLEPCDLPTAPVVKYVNVAYAVFGLAAIAAVPEPQAFILAAAILLQAGAGFVTLRGG